jgi:hypothetical protein
MQRSLGLCGALFSTTLASTLLCGCAPTSTGGATALESQNALPQRLEASFAYGAYGVDSSDSSLILSTVPLKALETGDFEHAQIIHAQLMWQPIAGKTPVNSNATNVVLRYIILVGDQVGVYGGGGFAWPTGTPGTTPLSLDITGSNLALTASTEGFRDVLSPATLEGELTGKLDHALMQRFRNVVSQLVTDRLGRTLWIYAAGDLPSS